MGVPPNIMPEHPVHMLNQTSFISGEEKCETLGTLKATSHRVFKRERERERERGGGED
jgi:hypothetical protein